VNAGIEPARWRGQRGQTLMVFALGFSLFLFGLTCLVADSAYLYVWSGRVEAAAQLGAQSGADAVDPRFLYEQSLHIIDINPADMQGPLYTFQRACIQAGDQSAQVPRDAGVAVVLKTPDDLQVPDGTSCASDGCRVYAIVSRAVHLPIPLPGFPDTLTVRGTGYAAAVVGTDHATTTCSGVAWVPAPPH